MIDNDTSKHDEILAGSKWSICLIRRLSNDLVALRNSPWSEEHDEEVVCLDHIFEGVVGQNQRRVNFILRFFLATEAGYEQENKC